MNRFKWPTPSRDVLQTDIEEAEGPTLQDRIENYSFLWEEFGPPANMLLYGGIPSMFALNELKRSYIYGNFMATVLLAQSFIELSLGGSYSMEGRDKIAGKGFAVLISSALQDGKLSIQLAEDLHRLRKMRNPYTHSSSGAGPKSYMERLSRSEFPMPEDLVAEDAKLAVQAVVDYLRHNSPDWSPENVEWNGHNKDE